MTLAHLLQRQARLAPERPAILEGTRAWATHAEWAARSAGLAQRLRDAGLQPGDRVVLFMRNHPRYLEILWGVWWAGGVVVPVNAKLHPAEAEWIIDDAQARWAFVTRDVAPKPLAGLEREVDAESVEAEALLAPLGDHAPEPAERRGDDLAWLFYTSGTTGRPKGVMLTHRNLMTMGLGYFVDVDPIAAGDVMVYAAPMSHGCGIYAIPHLMAGARHDEAVNAETQADAYDLQSAAETLATGSTVATVAGVVLLGVGGLWGVMSLVGGSDDDDEEAALEPLIGPAALGLRGRF